MSKTNEPSPEAIEQFKRLVGKLGDKPYYTQSDKFQLLNAGLSLGLPMKIIEDFIGGKSEHNGSVLKELGDKTQQLRQLKGQQEHAAVIERHIRQEVHSGKEGTTGPNSHSSPQVQAPSQPVEPRPAIQAEEYHQAIAALEGEVKEMLVATGGEGDNHKFSKRKDTKHVHEKQQTDKTKIPLTPLRKSFIYPER